MIAQRNLDVAISEIAEAKAEVERYEAATARWKAEYVRLQELAKANAVDIRVVQEAEEHFHAEQASERASKVQVMTKETERLAAQAEVDKAKVNVAAAQSAVQVAEATAARYAALLAYTRITAPYEGVVTARNVSVGDLVRPGTGDGRNRHRRWSWRQSCAPICCCPHGHADVRGRGAGTRRWAGQGRNAGECSRSRQWAIADIRPRFRASPGRSARKLARSPPRSICLTLRAN